MLMAGIQIKKVFLVSPNLQFKLLNPVLFCSVVTSPNLLSCVFYVCISGFYILTVVTYITDLKKWLNPWTFLLPKCQIVTVLSDAPADEDTSLGQFFYQILSEKEAPETKCESNNHIYKQTLKTFICRQSFRKQAWFVRNFYGAVFFFSWNRQSNIHTVLGQPCGGEKVASVWTSFSSLDQRVRLTHLWTRASPPGWLYTEVKKKEMFP